MLGTDLQDSKRLAVSKGSPQKEGVILKKTESGEAEIIQLPHVNCTVQSEGSIWCIGDADRLADSNEIIKTRATARKNFLFNIK